MFTGLLQNIGTVLSLDDKNGDLRIEIETDMNLDMVQIGASVCCSGCCLTVTRKTKSSFFIDASSETLRRTTLGAWGIKTRVNIEPSLKVGDEMGGHFVSGHIDDIAEIKDIKKYGGSQRIRISIPDNLKRFIATKGSVTIDGISLTVNDVDDKYFNVNIIPHSWKNTTLSDRLAGDNVNIEIDMLARYVARMVECE